MGEVTDEGSDPEEEVEGSDVFGRTVVRDWGAEAELDAWPMRSDHEEARHRHELNIENLRQLRAHRDNLNDLIREAVRDEDLSRRALAVYEKAAEGS